MIGFQKTNPRQYDWESNDCVVRASSLATGKPYAEMHAAYKAAGRKDRRGTPVMMIGQVLDYNLGVAAPSRRRALTLARFLKIYSTGRWVMCNARHAWAVIDGVVHDAGPVGARTRVLNAWRVD